MPHQVNAFDYAMREKCPAFFLEMRCGKTLVTIRWAKSLSGVRRILIIAPLTVLETWERELREEGESFTTCYGFSAIKRREAIAEAWFKGEERRHWLLMNYEGLLNLGEVRTVKRKDGRIRRIRQVPGVAFLPWCIVGLDESTKIKNPSAQITKVCIGGFRNVSHRALLTGLANPEGDLDLVSQFLFLDGHFMGHTDFWHARNELFEKKGYQWVHREGVKARIKQYVHRRAFVMTAAQAGMPSRVQYQTRRVEPSPAQRRMYKQVEDEYAAVLLSGEEVSTQWVLTQRLWLQRIAGGFDPEENLLSSAKSDELKSLLKGELANRKVIVWFKFRAELEHCREVLTKAGISCVSLMGGETLRSRTGKLETFRGRTRVLLAMEKLSFGFDASVADTAIYYSNEWSNQDRSQSEKRIVHPKKKRTHLIIDLVTRGTIDEEVVKAVKEKKFESKFFMSKLEEEFLKRYGSANRKTQAASRKPRSKPAGSHNPPETLPFPVPTIRRKPKPRVAPANHRNGIRRRKVCMVSG
jgi:hypothetical protein